MKHINLVVISLGRRGPPGKSIKGDKGDKGMIGVKGDMGYMGIKGRVGDEGVKGEKGNTGQSGGALVSLLRYTEKDHSFSCSVDFY